MQCEVCGRQIAGKPYRVVIEGAKMTTCEKCAKLGSDYWEPEFESPKQSMAIRTRTVVQSPSVRRGIPISVPDIEIVENFGSLVRQAREKLGLNHEELGKKIGEKVSVIRKIEREKIVPDQKLAAKLEHTLKIKLLIIPTESETVPLSSPPSTGVTLGEIVQLKGEKGRNLKDEGDRGPSERPI